MKKIIKLFLNKIGYNVSKINELENKIPIEASNFEINLINQVKEFSMCDYKNLYLSTQVAKYVKEKNIEGDIVECGVWKGGNLMIFNSLLKFYKMNKKIFAYDTFEGMTKPSNFDLDFKGNLANDLLVKTKVHSNNHDNIWCYSTLDNVKNNIKKITGEIANINFINGDVLETLDKSINLPNKISILRLDTDFYESTKKELEVLFPLLQNGGVLIIDDYGHWSGAKKAVDEYFKNKYYFKHVINGSCRMIIK